MRPSALKGDYHEAQLPISKMQNRREKVKFHNLGEAVLYSGIPE
jgi:hypothetical protein